MCDIRFIRLRDRSNIVEERYGLQWLQHLEYPVLPFDVIKELSPMRTCVCFRLDAGFSRHLIEKPRYMLHFDFSMQHSIMSEHLLDVQTPTILLPEGMREVELAMQGGRKILVNKIARVRMRGFDNNQIFDLTIGIIEKHTDCNFDYNRIILGRGQLKKILASIGPPPLDSPFDGVYVVEAINGYFEVTFEIKRERERR